MELTWGDGALAANTRDASSPCRQPCHPLRTDEHFTERFGSYFMRDRMLDIGSLGTVPSPRSSLELMTMKSRYFVFHEWDGQRRTKHAR